MKKTQKLPDNYNEVLLQLEIFTIMTLICNHIDEIIYTKRDMLSKPMAYLSSTSTYESSINGNAIMVLTMRHREVHTTRVITSRMKGHSTA